MHTKSRLLIITLASTIFAGCAALQPLPTPTGKPEVTINTSDTTRIKGALVSTVSEMGYALVQDTPYSMIFSRQLQGGQAVLYQAALGNAYSSTPQMNISFTFAPQGSSTRVFAHINTTMQNGFGATNQNNMDRGKAAHEVQAMLESLKFRLETSRRGN